MKKHFLLAALCSCISVLSFAQTSVPAGMKYQAVARSNSGDVLPNKQVILKIDLKSDPNKGGEVYYSEEHLVTTNALGLFDLVVGGGTVTGKGLFSNVPWSTSDIWMAVSLKEKGGPFSGVSESKLLAVPYAFYAVTASSLVGNTTAGSVIVNGNTPGVPSNNWSLQGNYNSNPLTDKLGNTDYVDLVIVTNNLERMRIKANGDIELKRSLKIGANLNVDSSVSLNNVKGSTISNGPFTVAKLSPTLLSGTLTVDGATDLNASLNVDGPADLNSRLFVNNLSPTKLTGTLQVNGITDLNSALNVNNSAPTLLTGILTVNKSSLFHDKVYLDNATYQSTDVHTGALVVNGGFGLGGNLNVGGKSTFGGPVAFGSAVRMTDLTESVDTSTGALIVSGGVAVGKRLNVWGNAWFQNNARVDGLTTLTNIAQSTTPTTGALVVSGGEGVALNLNVGGGETVGSTLTVAGVTNLNNALNVTTTGDYAANFTNNNASGNGVSIKIGNGTPSNDNNFVTFQNSSGTTVGRIEGETLSELHGSEEYKFDLATKTYDVISGAVDLTLASVNLAETVAFQIEADASVNVCAGLGVVACPPIASFVAGSIAEVVVASVEEAFVIAEVAIASTDLGLWVTSKDNSIGVTYQSGSGDYAEYLMKRNENEKFVAGDIVGVKGGRISKSISGAEKILAISYKPIVLGNTPNAGAEKSYEKVAFLGQVPVKVFGKVKLGDFIIPNGLDNGVGVAVSPENLDPKDARNIVGIAWTTSDKEIGLSNINVAIGLGGSDNQNLIAKQQNEIDELKNQISQTNAQLERLVPGFKSQPNIAMANASVSKNPGSKNTLKLDKSVWDNLPANSMQYPVNMGANEVQYFTVTKEDFMKGFEVAKDKMVDNGSYSKYEKFWSRFNSDASYKEAILGKLMKTYKKELDAHKALDAKLNN